MSAPQRPHPDALIDLLADRATVASPLAEQAKVEMALRDDPNASAEALELELAAAALDLALFDARQCPPMPEAIRSSLERDADAWIRATSTPVVEAERRAPQVIGTIRPSGPRPSSGGRLGWMAASGWLAAAAAITLAFVAWSQRPGSGQGPTLADSSEARARLLANASDIKQWNWAALGELERTPVSGDVVWSTAAQRGYMSFAGLPANDPTREQYQLWIFDPAQSDKTPIDGGVFDVRSGSGVAVVAIDPKIRVSDAVLFAITIEKPGGVVVSDRSRLVLLAKPG